MLVAPTIIVGSLLTGALAYDFRAFNPNLQSAVGALLANDPTSCADTDAWKDFKSLPEATNFCSTLLSIRPMTSLTTSTIFPQPVTFTATEPITTGTDIPSISRATLSETTTITMTNTVTGVIDVRSPTSSAPASSTPPTSTPPITASTSTPPAAPTKRMVTVALSLNIFDDGSNPTNINIMPSLTSLCNCLSLPTPKITQTVLVGRRPSTITVFSLAPVTVTATSMAVATSTFFPLPASCNNSGVQFGGFKYPFGQGPPYTLDAQFVRDQRARDNFLDSGVTTVPLGWSFTTDPCPADSPGLPYGPVNRSCSAYTYDHRGYFFAPIAGNFTFTLRFVDDLALLWLGDLAYRNYTRANATLESQVRNSNGTASYMMELGAGTYTPYRLMMGNVGGPTHGFFDVVAPGGTKIIDSQITRAKNPYLVQFGCADEPNATPFPTQVSAKY